MKVLIFLLLSFQVLAETREEVRIRELNKTKIFNEKSQQRIEQNKKDRARLVTSSETVGYTIFDPTSKKTKKAFSRAFNTDAFIEAVLILKLFCSGPESSLPIPAAMKNTNWEINEKSKGSAQSDRLGFVRIGFSYKGNKDVKFLNLVVGDKKLKIDLLKGPYEIFLNEKSCL